MTTVSPIGNLSPGVWSCETAMLVFSSSNVGGTHTTEASWLSAGATEVSVGGHLSKDRAVENRDERKLRFIYPS